MDTTSLDARQKDNSCLEEINQFIEDLLLLATFAVEQGRLPDEVSLADIYRTYTHKIEDGLPLSSEDIQLLQFYYQLLKIELAPVSATSLRATECNLKHKKIESDASKQVRKIWSWAFLSIAALFIINIYQYSFEFNKVAWIQSYPDLFTYLSIGDWLAAAIIPFVYGALGASLRILRAVESRLKDRSFDPRRMPEHTTRWVLGTISGGVIVMFYSSGGVNDPTVKLTEAALGFLAGYSIDFLFSILDNLVNILSPSKPSNSAFVQKTRLQAPIKAAEIKQKKQMSEVVGKPSAKKENIFGLEKELS